MPKATELLASAQPGKSSRLRIPGDDPNRREEKLLELVPTNESSAFDMHAVISCIVDQGEFFEIKRYWAANLIIGLTRLGGQVAGIIANNPRDKGGCMTLDAADKMARFVRFCDAFNIPLIWLADCPGFLPSVSEETRGLIRHGCKTIYANSQATVPQITVSIRKLYGGGGLAMPGTGLGGDLLVSWPVLARGVMGVDGAVAILYKGELAAIKDEAERENTAPETASGYLSADETGGAAAASGLYRSSGYQAVSHQGASNAEKQEAATAAA